MKDKDIRAVEAAAARWFVRLHDHPVSRQTEAEFDAWLDQAAEHRACYMRCEMSLALTRGLEDDPELKADFDECARIAAEEARQPAAQPQAVDQLAPWRRWGAIRTMWTGAAAATVAAIAVGGYLLGDRVMPLDYRTGVGEQRTVVLADQSSVTLNTDTQLSVLLGDDLRRIDLKRGEAFFSVAHDPGRPFEVWAAGGLVRAVGTQFGVHIERDEVTVSVIEGAVVVLPQPAERTAAAAGQSLPVPQLDANESVSYRSGGAIGNVHEADVRRINAWREGKLAFDEVRLREAIAEYNRYTTRKVLLGSDEIGDLTVSGVLRIGDADSLMFLLRESLGLRTVQQGGAVLVMPAQAPAAAN